MDTTDVGVLDEADRACLDELGEYLVSADAWQRFAIWLLHKHFEPDAGEVFLESIIAVPRGTETTPVGRSSARGSKPISIRFDPDVSSGVGIIGMEYADPAGFGSTSSVSPDDEAVLAGIAERLRAHGKTVRFGVRLIRNPLGLSENEVLVEICDIVRRTLHCSVGERDGVHRGNTVETSWQWKPDVSGTGLKVKQYCMSQCSADFSGSHYISGHTNIPDFSRDPRKLLR
jgi:hypothetical protein